MKPFPVIHLTSERDHAVLLRGLYELGYQYMGCPTFNEAWKKWMGGSMINLDQSLHYTWIIISRYGITAYNKPEFALRNTPVNSVRHFLHYARSLRSQEAEAEKVEVV